MERGDFIKIVPSISELLFAEGILTNLKIMSNMDIG